MRDAGLFVEFLCCQVLAKSQKDVPGRQPVTYLGISEKCAGRTLNVEKSFGFRTFACFDGHNAGFKQIWHHVL